MSTTRARVASEIAHECLDNIIVRALEKGSAVPEVSVYKYLVSYCLSYPNFFSKVHLPRHSATARVIHKIHPENTISPIKLGPSEVHTITKTLDNVKYIEKNTKRRGSKRKNTTRKTSKAGNANKQIAGRKRCIDGHMVPGDDNSKPDMDRHCNRSYECQTSNFQRGTKDGLTGRSLSINNKNLKII